MTPRPDPVLSSEARGEPRAEPRAPVRLAPLAAGNEHPLIPIPFTASVDGRQYAGEGLSLVEARVAGLADPALDGRERLVRLHFDFGGFGVTLQPAARVAVEGPGRLSLRFTDPAGEHLPQLRLLLNDFISGDLSAVGPVIRAAALGPAGAAPRRAARPSPLRALRRLAGSLAVLALTFALVATAAFLVGQRVLVTRLDAPGRVVLDGPTLRAVASGQLSFLDTGAGEGEVAFALASTSGETLSIVMPCDCTATPAPGVAEGATLVAGEPVLHLVEGAAEAVVVAAVPPADLFALEEAGGAEIRLAGGGTTFGRLEARGPATADGGPVEVRLRPEAPLDAGLAGQAVELVVRRDPARAVERLRAAVEPLGERLRSVWPAVWPAGA